MKFIREASIYEYNKSPSQELVNSYMELYNSLDDKPGVIKTSEPKQSEDKGSSPEQSTRIIKKGGRRSRSSSIRSSQKSRLLLSNKKIRSKRRKSIKKIRKNQRQRISKSKRKIKHSKSK